MRNTLSCFVRSKPGVLEKVAKKFAEGSFNIHSLAVNETDDESARLTIVVDCEKEQLADLSQKLAEVPEVISVEDLDRSGFLDRELVLAKIDAKAMHLPRLMQVVEVMHATVVQMTPETMTVEMTGTEDKISAFVRLLEPFGIKECARSGRVAVSTGDTK